MLAITFDDPTAATAFIDKHGFSWPILANQQALIDQAKVSGYLATLLLDGEGKVARATVGLTDGPPSVAKLWQWTQGG